MDDFSSTEVTMPLLFTSPRWYWKYRVCLKEEKIIQIIAAIFAQYPVSDNLTHQSKVSFQQFFLNYKVKLKVNTCNNILTVTFLG